MGRGVVALRQESTDIRRVCRRAAPEGARSVSRYAVAGVREGVARDQYGGGSEGYGAPELETNSPAQANTICGDALRVTKPQALIGKGVPQLCFAA